MKKLILCSLLMLIVQQYGDAQTVGSLIKKIKPVKKTETGSTDKSQPGDSGIGSGKSAGESGSSNSNSKGSSGGSANSSSPGSSGNNDGGGQDSKASYETLYKGDPNCKSSLIYNESRIGIGAGSSGYSLVVKKNCGGKDSYDVIENGKQTGSYDDRSRIPMSADLLSKSGDDKDPASKEKNYIKESGGKQSVVVDGKSYGSYVEIQEVFVTPDRKTVFHDWMDESSRTGISFNGKKTDITPIDEMEDYYIHKLIKSHDKNTLAFLCMSQPEGQGKVTIPAILIKPDGTKKAIKINNIDAYSGNWIFSVSSSKEICWLDTETWDLYTEGRKVGSFKKNNSAGASDLSIIVGADLNKAVLYDRMGNLYFQDGHMEAAGAVYPFLTTSNGKQYISWLKQEGENILKGSIEIK